MERVLRGVDSFFSFSGVFFFIWTDGWINDITVAFVLSFLFRFFFSFPKWVVVLRTNISYTLDVVGAGVHHAVIQATGCSGASILQPASRERVLVRDARV